MRHLAVVLAISSVLGVASVGHSSAADIPPPAAVKAPAMLSPVSFAWSGFYVGVHGGYGFGDGNVDVGIVDPIGVTQLVAADGGFPLKYTFDRSGYVAGAQAGFNWQTGAFVWGVEADFSATGIDGSATVFTPMCPNFCGFPNTSTVTQNMDWFGTARVRAGYAYTNWLFYGTGGLAFGHVKYSYSQTNVPFGGGLTIAATDDVVQLGWTVGAGVEYGWDRWSGRVEYLYYDLGDHSFTALNPLAPPGLGIGVVPNFQNTGSIVRAAVNYKLY